MINQDMFLTPEERERVNKEREKAISANSFSMGWDVPEPKEKQKGYEENKWLR